MRLAIGILVGGLLILVGAVLFVNSYGRSDYIRFVEENSNYYSKFAAACDTLLARNPVGTNVCLWISHTNLSLLDQGLESKEYTWISKTNLPLPAIIQELHPDAVRLRSNSVWIGMVNRGARFGIQWAPQDDGPTNIWVLHTISESGWRQHYSKTR